MKNVILREITLQEFQDMISESVKLQLQVIVPLLQQNVYYLSSKEVAAELKVSKPTVLKWAKMGILIKHRIGSRVFFERTQVMKAVKAVNTIKYKREINFQYENKLEQ
ncbi:MAG: helix-turn-helix domain-containing protein [Bacteroidia bacterium]|nr:helix-turn-helix domain-containing protein [Bacteroidia bacterium]